MNDQTMPQSEFYTPETGVVNGAQQSTLETEVPQSVVEGAQQMNEQNPFANVKPAEAMPEQVAEPVNFNEIGDTAEKAWPEKEPEGHEGVIDMARSSENLKIEDPTEIFKEINTEAQELITKLDKLIDACTAKEKDAEADEAAARKSKIDASATKEKAIAYKKRIEMPDIPEKLAS